MALDFFLLGPTPPMKIMESIPFLISCKEAGTSLQQPAVLHLVDHLLHILKRSTILCQVPNVPQSQGCPSGLVAGT
jgi:hypothetical protein